jgi:hypothetical protein
VAPATHQPAPGDTQGNVSRQLAGAVVLGGGAAPAPPLAGSGRSCAPSIRAAKKNARCPGLRALCPEAWSGWLSYAHWSRGGQEEEEHHAPFLVFPTIAACKRRNARPTGGNAQSQPQVGVAASNHRPLIISDPSSTPRGWGDPSRQPQCHLHRLFLLLRKRSG